jgi:steroid 5-alpha reductase family enzyme
MSTFHIWLHSLPVLVILGLVAWGISTARRNVGLVDIFWSLFYLGASISYVITVPLLGERAGVVLALVTLWALRLALYLALRNWSAPEDHRYRAIRERNEPGFVWKSLYLVFALQVLLAWLITAPLAAAIASTSPLNAVDVLAAALVIGGTIFEAVGDMQLSRFKADPTHAGKVMDQGLWRYTRHPNYFGEFCVSWGFYLFALAAGTWWTIFAPLLMSVLLLRVSGVTLLEKDIAERRPGYREYVSRTNAFFPGPRRSK